MGRCAHRRSDGRALCGVPLTTQTAAALAACFEGHGEIATARARGRVDLIGEHTDRNEGFVLLTGVEDCVGVEGPVRDVGRAAETGIVEGRS